MNEQNRNVLTSCRICAGTISPFMSFGKMPIANGFLTADEIPDEYFFELAPAFCHRCGMFQIVEQPRPEKMFHDRYAFFSSTSRYMQVHFEKMAAQLRADYLASVDDPFVVELGSNDGILLKNFQSRNIRHLGVEPSGNVAEVARGQGIRTISKFFGPQLADEIVSENGRADLVMAANVMCHIPDLASVATAVARLLKSSGVFVFEDPYLGDMIAKTSYDQIYDEHVFIFSATSVSSAFAMHGLELIDTQPQPTHGGSMRYVLAPRGSRPVAPRVIERLELETKWGLDQPRTYEGFRQSCERSRSMLMQVLETARDQQKRVVGYGATSKSTTVTNYCGITSDHIEFISDTTPIKQGKLSPGAHIPVRPYDAFLENFPNYALLFAWNHAEEIQAKEDRFIQSGGAWVVYVPEVKIVS